MPALRTDHLADRLRAVPAVAALLPGLAGERGVHAVGGVPRDLLLGLSPLDLDLVVEGDAGALAERLAGRLGGRVTEHGRFGTATLLVGEHSIDLAGARSERYPRPGALPDVAPAPLAEDLRRRDFTANAIALALDEQGPGGMLAYPGAEGDLAARRLRVLHPASFEDDPTRLLRLARYTARLGFTAEPATDAIARRAIAAEALGSVSAARVGAELRLLLAEADPAGALDAAETLGLVAAIDAEWRWDRPLAERALRLLPGEERADLLLLGALGAGAGRKRLAARLDALELERADRERVLAVAGARALVPALATAQQPSEVRAAVDGAPAEAVALAGALEPAAEPAAALWLATLRGIGLAIGGADLLAAGVPEGPAVGRGLEAALDAALDGRAPDREGQLVAALRAARGS
ncbi:MAG: hypothetical protein U0T02_13415 [Solirubrobacteraceae bacterium]